MNNSHTNINDIDTLARLPASASCSLNRCNLPANILGGYRYQRYPIPLHIDCVAELHREFFVSIAAIDSASIRAHHFHQYMCSAFLLGKSDEAGLMDNQPFKKRDKIDYRRLLRGWMFNPDGIEAAVMKRWVESRFGLLALNHGGLLTDHNGAHYQRFLADYVRGLYNTNALESQLDLLYSYCQYELQRTKPDIKHQLLYRGVNALAKHHRVYHQDNKQPQILLNNLNSFSSDRCAAEAFGDVILAVQVPLSKLLYYPQLLPGILAGEQEYLVLGGVYQVEIVTF